MKIALCQTPIEWENVEENIAYYNNILDDIFKNKPAVDLVVFPELFTYGFSVQGGIFEDTDGPTTKWLRCKSKEYKVALVGSVPILDEGKVYNRAIFVTPDDSQFVYNKRHLFSYGEENKVFSAGNEHTIIDFNGWKIALQICYDLRFPVWSRNIDLSYDIIINMANWPKSREKVVDPLVRARAIENLCYFAFVNRTGSDPSNSYNKIGFVADYKGEKLDAFFVSNDLNYQIYELSMEKLKDFRKKFRVWEDSDKFIIK